MFGKRVACPVCGGALGTLTKGEVCSFPCRECGWIFSWDAGGKPGKPVKLVSARKPEPCDCAGCRDREDRKRRERRDFF